jgi:integrase
MPRTNRPPSYRKHKASGRAIVTFPNGTRHGQDVYLGTYGSPESKKLYARLIAEWQANGGHIPTTTAGPTDLSVAELLLKFWHHAKAYYKTPAGAESNELDNFRYSLKPVRELYATLPAVEFGPVQFKTVRQRMIDSGLARTVVNRRAGRIKFVFRWATGEGLVPPAVYQALQAVAGLARGRTEAKETDPVTPVDDATVEKTLPFLPPHVRGIVQFMRLTGCRPGEACRLTRAEIDTTGDVWTYTPSQHKTSYRGKSRVVHIGPKARALLNQYPTEDPTDYVFSPIRQRAQRYAAMRAGRKSRVQPSQLTRANPKAKRRPGRRYTPRAVHRAIVIACDKAGVERWHANQLRHTAGTAIRKAFGLESAAATLGHDKLTTTLTYAERNADLAVRVALAIG